MSGQNAQAPVDVKADERRCHCCGEPFARCRETYRGTSSQVNLMAVLDRQLRDRAERANRYSKKAAKAARKLGQPQITADRMSAYENLLFSELREARAAVAELIDAAKRANGDHSAPHDCYATGPLTGDPIRDLVSCPGCELAAAISRFSGGV